MIVRFGSIEEFLDDLKASASAENGEAVDDQVVRVSIETRELSQTSWSIQLTAGFVSLGELRYLTLDCGTDFARQTPTARETADGFAKNIRELCGTLGLTVRGGRFEET